VSFDLFLIFQYIGARMVTGGIGKGAKFVGEGISKTHNKVKGPQEEETTENAQKKAAIGVGGKPKK
jgi:hypothetical protein